VFADIRSPNTVRNLRGNPSIELNVVDPIVRKGPRSRIMSSLALAGGAGATPDVVAFYPSDPDVVGAVPALPAKPLRDEMFGVRLPPSDRVGIPPL